MGDIPSFTWTDATRTQSDSLHRRRAARPGSVEFIRPLLTVSCEQPFNFANPDSPDHPEPSERRCSGGRSGRIGRSPEELPDDFVIGVVSRPVRPEVPREARSDQRGSRQCSRGLCAARTRRGPAGGSRSRHWARRPAGFAAWPANRSLRLEKLYLLFQDKCPRKGDLFDEGFRGHDDLERLRGMAHAP